jgi:hypothetical protein
MRRRPVRELQMRVLDMEQSVRYFLAFWIRRRAVTVVCRRALAVLTWQGS